MSAELMPGAEDPRSNCVELLDRDHPPGPLPQLLRVLPRCWHKSTLPWNRIRPCTKPGAVQSEPPRPGARPGTRRSLAPDKPPTKINR